MKKLKLLDTFSGIGGFSYAAEKLVGGFETTQFVEIDPYCQKVLKKHWPHIPIHDDIRTFTAEPFQFDAVCGGFPCQDLSVAGRGKGITPETRSGLFYELMRVVRMVRPKYVILENVAAILNNGLDIVLGELSEAGYDAEWAVISASSLGACHQRSRWWLVAYPKSERLQRGVRNSKGEGWEVLPTEQHDRNEIRSEIRRIDGVSSKEQYAAYPNNNGQQRREFETRNKVASRQDSQIIRSTNTSELKRCSDDGKDKRQSRTDGNLSGSSDGGKTISTETGGICNLSQKSNNDQKTSRENKNQQNNDRTLVSEGQSRVQLPEHRKLGGDKTISKNNSVRQGDDNHSDKRMDNQNSIATNPDSLRTQSKNYKPNNASWKMPISDSKTKRTLNPNWREYVSKPVLCRGNDGLRGRVDRLKALGNSVVPQVAAIPMQRVLDIENNLNK